MILVVALLHINIAKEVCLCLTPVINQKLSTKIFLKTKKIIPMPNRMKKNLNEYIIHPLNHVMEDFTRNKLFSSQQYDNKTNGLALTLQQLELMDRNISLGT